nr:hypothetical protein [uncultured bacterium]
MSISANGFPDFLGASERSTFEMHMRDIAHALCIGRMELLAGAGMSRESGVPCGAELGKLFLESILSANPTTAPSAARIDELLKRHPLELIAEAVEQIKGTKRAFLTALLTKHFVTTQYDLNAAHKTLQTLHLWFGKPLFSRIFTTNFDLLLEKTFGDCAKTITETNYSQIRECEINGLLPIIHLHGTLERDDTYQITEKDLFNPSQRFLKNELLNALYVADAFVFIGYSMSDPDFRSLYREYLNLMELRQQIAAKTYLVAPASDWAEFMLGQEIWKGRNAVWIPLDASSFFRLLRNELERISDAEVRSRLKKRLSIQDDDALDERLAELAATLEYTIDETKSFLLDSRDKSGARV